jgi:hypothetical protein
MSMLLRTLDATGLRAPAAAIKRSVKRFGGSVRTTIKAHGWGYWRPLVPEDAFGECVRNAIRILRRDGDHTFGDYLEFGVSRGTSMAAVFRALDNERLANVRLVGFDSFEGMPEGSEKEGWAPGTYKSTEGATKRYLKSKAVDMRRVTLIKGWFAETLTPRTVRTLNLRKASLIMIDCDIYSASKEALWFSEPLIDDRAVVLFDDWGWRAKYDQIGQREAFDEFLAAFPTLKAEPLPSYFEHARVFLLTRQRQGMLH